MKIYLVLVIFNKVNKVVIFVDIDGEERELVKTHYLHNVNSELKCTFRIGHSSNYRYDANNSLLLKLSCPSLHERSRSSATA